MSPLWSCTSGRSGTCGLEKVCSPGTADQTWLEDSVLDPCNFLATCKDFHCPVRSEQVLHPENLVCSIHATFLRHAKISIVQCAASKSYTPRTLCARSMQLSCDMQRFPLSSAQRASLTPREPCV